MSCCEDTCLRGVQPGPVFAPYPENEWTEFNQILYTHDLDKIYVRIVKSVVVFFKFTTELQPLIEIRILFSINILRINKQNLTKFCILIITDKIYAGIFMYHQFFKQSYAPVYLCPLIVLWRDYSQIL